MAFLGLSSGGSLCLDICVKQTRRSEPPRMAVVITEAIFWLCQNSQSTDEQGSSSVDCAISVAENKHSFKCNSWENINSRRLLHWCAERAYVNRRVCGWANSQCFSAALFQRLKINIPFSATIQMPPTTVQLEHYTARLWYYLLYFFSISPIILTRFV